MDRKEVPPDRRHSAADRTGAWLVLHGHGLLRAREPDLRHAAVSDALPDRVPLYGTRLTRPAVRRRARGRRTADFFSHSISKTRIFGAHIRPSARRKAHELRSSCTDR